MQYQLFTTNSLLIKIFSVIVLQLYGIIIIMTLREAGKFFSREIPIITLLLVSLIISIHPDTIMAVLWISNVNELLAVLFYSATLFLFFRTINNKRLEIWSIILLLVLYLLSIGAKQQGLHLPILLLFIIIVFRNKIHKQLRNQYIRILMLGCIVMVLITIGNYLSHEKQIIELKQFGIDYLFKKPFAIIGTILIIYSPRSGQIIYDYFLKHPEYALIIIVGSIILYIYFRKGKYLFLPQIAFTVIFILILFFPRAFAPGGDRLNMILIFALFTTSTLLLVEKTKVLNIGLLCYAILMVYPASQQVNDMHTVVKLHKELCESLDKYSSDVTKYLPYYTSFMPTSHSYYYHRNSSFGEDINIVHSGIVISDNRSWFRIVNTPHLTLYGDTLKVIAKEPFMNLDWDYDFSPTILSVVRDNKRGYNNITLLIADSLKGRDIQILEPVGTNWRLLK
jgi:hypothetical protein